MKRLKLAFALLAIAIMAVMGYTFYKNYDIIAQVDVTRELLNPSAELSLKKPHFVEREGDKKVLEVDADEAHYFKQGLLVELKKPRIVFYRIDGEKTFARAAEGTINTETNDMELKGDVVVDTFDGKRIVTTYLKYSGAKKVITSDKRVRVTGEGFDIVGTGMRAKVEEDVFYLYKDVEAEFRSGFNVFSVETPGD